VNAVAIGITDTSWNRAEAGGADTLGTGTLDGVPTRRKGTVEEIADVFAFWPPSARATSPARFGRPSCSDTARRAQQRLRAHDAAGDPAAAPPHA